MFHWYEKNSFNRINSFPFFFQKDPTAQAAAAAAAVNRGATSEKLTIRQLNGLSSSSSIVFNYSLVFLCRNFPSSESIGSTTLQCIAEYFTTIWYLADRK